MCLSLACKTVGHQYCDDATKSQNNHWAGGGSGSGSCYCQFGFSGDSCQYTICPERLYPVSMGSMFILADRRLREYSDLFDTHDNRTIEEVKLHLHTVLSSYVDYDGDGSINKTEMVAALRSKGVGFNITSKNSRPYFNTKLWCQTPSLDLENCYQESGVNQLSDSATVSVEDMFRDAWENFMRSVKHRFGKIILIMAKHFIVINSVFRR